MSDIFVEVDEALKQEKLEALWQKYGGLIIGALIAIVLGTAANEGYKAWKTNHDTKQTSLYMSVSEKDDVTVDAFLSLTDKTEGGLQTLTQINAASTALKNGNTEKATSIYTQISGSPNAEESFRALASYMAVHTSPDITQEQKLANLQTIAKDNSNPWSDYAKLDAALILGEEHNDFTQAQTYLKEINDNEKAPKTLRQKAQSIDILYAIKKTKTQ